ncbi:MAG: hypothetical protein LQ338_005723 [Usnochroma carphineum]|nr:MAG: hypothetical protein LQ338_005723 [Usnochroma carphineum]
MASHSLAIAKASLAASLMRPEPASVPRADIAQFHRLLDTLMSQCTTTNIQVWWLRLKKSDDMAEYKMRIALTGAVGKYLVALSASLSTSQSAGATDQATASKLSSRRRQLNILYLLHDLLHHTKFHAAAFAETIGSDRTFEPYVSQLVALASAHDPTKYLQHFRKLKDLIDIWSGGEYYPSPFIVTLRKTVANASSGNNVASRNIESQDGLRTLGDAGIESRRDAPYMMPPTHGDISVPFYDLPAGNLMPCIVPNSTTPINPRIVKPLECRAGPADERIVQAVKALLQDADSIYGAERPGYDIDKSDIDELGQLVIHDDLPGEYSVRGTALRDLFAGIRTQVQPFVTGERTALLKPVEAVPALEQDLRLPLTAGR